MHVRAYMFAHLFVREGVNKKHLLVAEWSASFWADSFQLLFYAYQIFLLLTGGYPCPPPQFADISATNSLFFLLTPSSAESVFMGSWKGFPQPIFISSIYVLVSIPLDTIRWANAIWETSRTIILRKNNNILTNVEIKVCKNKIRSVS